MKIQQLAPVLALTLSACAAAPTGQNAHQTPATSAQPAQIISAAPPPYPPSERRYSHVGRVTINARILADGSISGLELAESSGWPALDEAAFRAIETWSFSAATDEAGRSIESVRPVSLRFNLTDPGPSEEAPEFFKMDLSVSSFTTYKYVSPLLFRICDGLGLDADHVIMKFNADNRELDDRAAKLQASLLKDAPPEYGPDPLDYIQRKNQRLAEFYARDIQINALVARGDNSKRVFCNSLAEKVSNAQWGFQNFDSKGYEVLMTTSRNTLE